jgi:predicted ATPase
VLRGLITYYLVRAQLQTAYQLGKQLLRLAQSQPESTLLMLAHYSLGQVVYMLEGPASAHTHHAQALALYTPQEHRALVARYGLNLGVGAGSILAMALWQLGYPDQALQHSQAARRQAQEVAHPYTLATALIFAAIFHQFRREALATRQLTEAAMTLATEQGFAWYLAWGTIFHGWALAMQGQGEAGIAEMRQGLAADLAMGSKVWQPYCLSLLAEVYGAGGHPEAGLEVLAEAAAVMDTMELRFYAAELSRLKGALLLQQAVPDVSQAEVCFHQALAIARQQQAKSWELRTAMSLARLWHSQRKRQAAYDLLAPVYHWFTEGFDTADVQEGRGLLEALS